MSDRRFTGVRARLLLLGLLALLPALGLLIYTAVRLRERDEAAAKAEAFRMARAAAASVDDAVADARDFLQVLAAHPLLLGQDRAAQSRYLGELLAGRAGYLNLGLCSADGFIVASGLPAALPMEVRSRSFYVRAMATRRFALSDYQIGRITGEPSLNAALPVLDGEGEVRFVLFAALSVRMLLSPQALAELDPSASCVVLDAAGTVLYRHPSPEAYVGRPVAGLPAVREILARREGALEGPGLDGIHRLMGFAGLRGGGEGPGAFVAVSLPLASAYAEARKILTLHALGLALVAALALGATWLFGDFVLVRRIDRLADAARRMTAGDLSARAGGPGGGGELGDLERAFDGMAATVEALTREREKELKRARTELEAFFRHSIDLLAVADVDGYFKRLNPAWEKTLGWTEAELRAKPWIDFVHPDDRAETVAQGGKLAEGVDILRFVNRYLHKDGSYRWISWRVPAPEPGGTTLYATARDVTELRRSEEAVRELNAKLEEQVRRVSAANGELEAFSYSVSHDLRAPLRHLDGFARLLEQRIGGSLDETSKRHLEVISSSAKRMGQLIDDLLAFSRLGRAELRAVKVPLDALVRDCVASLRAEQNGRPVAWEIGPLPVAEGDPALLRQAFLNLLSNALKYTGGRADARVEIGATGGAGESVVFVKDNGAGFDMAYAHKLFGVFQRLHSSEDFEGTGIGLAIVRRVAERHGGRAWGEGRVGEGATFYLALPEGKGTA